MGINLKLQLLEELRACVKLLSETVEGDGKDETEVPRPGELSAALRRTLICLSPEDRARMRDVAQAMSMERTASQMQIAEQHAAILNALPTHVALVDRTGSIVSVNDSWKRFCEANGLPGLLAGSGPDCLGTCEHSRQGSCTHDRAIAEGIRSVIDGSRKQFTLEYSCPGGRWFRLVVNPAPGDLGGAVVTHQDFSEQKQLEDELSHAKKMEAVGRLAGGVAHEFNNQLTVIIGYCEFLLESLDRNDSQWAFANEVLNAAQRAADVTAQLSAFGRRTIVAPQALDLNAVLRDAEKMLCRLLGESIEVRMDLDPNIGCVRIDFRQLTQALMNLAANARDAMPQGGRLRIRTRFGRPNRSSPANDDLTANGPYILLEMSDTGCGIPDGVREHLFEPFFTTKGVGEGSGLGLPAVYGIATQAGGTVEVSSAVGEGTTVRVYLPQVVENS